MTDGRRGVWSGGDSKLHPLVLRPLEPKTEEHINTKFMNQNALIFRYELKNLISFSKHVLIKYVKKNATIPDATD
jgi:hypothetical protein